jgi:hypothetical protein
MRHKRYLRRRYYLPVLGVLALGLLAGRAAMASNTVPTSTSGYGAATVTGATATNISYVMSPDGTTITSVSLTFAGDLTGRVVGAGFDGASLSPCTVGSYNWSTNSTPASCLNLAQSVTNAVSLAVAVHQ